MPEDIDLGLIAVIIIGIAAIGLLYATMMPTILDQWWEMMTGFSHGDDRIEFIMTIFPAVALVAPVLSLAAAVYYVRSA